MWKMFRAKKPTFKLFNQNLQLKLDYRKIIQENCHKMERKISNVAFLSVKDKDLIG